MAEVVGTIALRGLSRGDWPLLALVLGGYGLSFLLVAKVLRYLEVGTVYAIWSSLGTVLVAAAGVLCFGESLHPAKVAGVLTIAAGVVLLARDSGAVEAGAGER